LEKIALIVAGGSGKRMKSLVPKQFMPIKGLPVLMHTINKFHRYDAGIRIILVLPEDQMTTWKDLCGKNKFSVKHEVVKGGDTRFHSVQKNLGEIPEECLVAVHDGVRPLVSMETIHRCFISAAEKGNAVPCVEIPETLRILDENGNKPADRSKYRLIQTPQVFFGGVLKEAYQQEYRNSFTDDATVVESRGHTIHLVEGNPENIKITLKHDLAFAESLLGDIEDNQYHL
jgi:2-C-methyl-D-erythritol 4-phosphate cytidylyltransferase